MGADKQTLLATLRETLAARKLSYQDLGKAVGRSPVYLAAALRGQQRLGPDETRKLADALGIGADSAATLNDCPVRTDFPLTSDPFKYRLLEIVGVYGDALRDMANQMFGDGIMSAIDFTIDMERVVGSQGEARVKITMNGKWLPYKEF